MCRPCLCWVVAPGDMCVSSVAVAATPPCPFPATPTTTHFAVAAKTNSNEPLGVLHALALCGCAYLPQGNATHGDVPYPCSVHPTPFAPGRYNHGESVNVQLHERLRALEHGEDGLEGVKARMGATIADLSAALKEERSRSESVRKEMDDRVQAIDRDKAELNK